MAASALSSFVVGIGYEMDRRSERAVGSSFDRIRKSALGIGKALSAAITGLGAMEMSFAKSDDRLSRWTDLYRMSTGAAEAWGRVFSLSGSGLPQFQSLVEQLSSNRAGLKRGDAGWIEEWGRTQLPPGISMSSSPEQMVLGLADWFRKAGADQRINAANVLGLDPGTVSALTQGSGSLQQQLAEAYSKYKISDDDVAAARQLNDELQGMMDSFEGLGRAVSKVMRGPLGAFFRAMESAADYGKETVEGNTWWQQQLEKMGGMGGATGAAGRNPQSSLILPIKLEVDGHAFGQATIEINERGLARQVQGIEVVS